MDDAHEQRLDELFYGRAGHELDDLDLPPMFRGHDRDLPYTREQLAPTVARLRQALELDLDAGTGTPQQRLAAAWTRIAELRLPRKAVPTAVLDEIERLVGIWDGYGQGGIARAAFTLTDQEVAHERQCLAAMLLATQAASDDDFPLTLLPTE